MPDQQRRHLEGSWSSLAQAVSETLIVAEEEDFAVINDEWQKWFPIRSTGPTGAKMSGARARLEGVDRDDGRSLKGKDDRFAHRVGHQCLCPLRVRRGRLRSFSGMSALYQKEDLGPRHLRPPDAGLAGDNKHAEGKLQRRRLLRILESP